MRHDPHLPPVSTAPRKPGTSHALAHAHVYRPGPIFAACILFAPPLLALAAAGATLHTAGRIPIWLPLLLLLWLPVLPLAWLTMISVRTSPAGIATARPWRQWVELRWTLIEHAQRRGLRIVLRSSDGRTAHFYPFILQGGARLKRELLMRLAAHVLDERLRGDARNLLGEPLGQSAENLLANPLTARPRPAWAIGPAAGTACALAGAGVALLRLPPPLAALVCALAVVVLALSVSVLPLCLQTVSLNELGIAVTGATGRHLGHMAWRDVQLIERTPRERVLRLRGDRRLRCPGPGLFAPAEREVFQAYLLAYCAEQGALVIVRRWL